MDDESKSDHRFVLSHQSFKKNFFLDQCNLCMSKVIKIQFDEKSHE